MTGWYYRCGGPRRLWQGGRWALPQNPPGLLLSFDDGPSGSSLRCAELLAAHKIRALFFLLGERARQAPELVSELTGLGHETGSHGMWHIRHTGFAPDRVRESLRVSREILEQAGGQHLHWFRPPFGAWWPWQNRLLAESGMHALYWNLNPHDYSGIPAAEIFRRLKRYHKGSSLALLHCTGRNQERTVRMLKENLPMLKELGLGRLSPEDLQS